MRRSARAEKLQRVAVSITPEAEDAVVELLAEVTSQPASVYADIESGRTTANVFLSKFSDTQRRKLRDGLRRIAVCGINVGPGRISVTSIRAEDWAESWKRHFKPLEISSRLLVKPSWSKRRPKRGQAVVVIDPGLSFGTGQHPTTEFCLRQIAAFRREDRRQSFLDMGTGSGILAIAAAKLGYVPVEAFDFDPDAVRVAKENARANEVRISIEQRDLTRLPLLAKRQFEVVCANLIYDLLIAERQKILRRVTAGRTLVLAGILNEQFSAVERAFTEAGARLVRKRTVKEWTSGAFHVVANR